MTDKCACGKPLHYNDPILKDTITQISKDHGDTVRVLSRGAWYRVQRHFIALHTPHTDDFERLANEGIIERCGNQS